ncbi:MAG: flagellar hook protein FlgE [Acidobacteriota bacterium]
MALTSMNSALSGLNAASLQLSIIGNNLANVNTTGFKSSTASFQDLLSQTLSGGSESVNPVQVGLGAVGAASSQNFTQGSLQTTGVASHVAIQGEGFFVVKDETGVKYTRAGEFTVDAKGNLVTPDGAFVQGYVTKDPVTNQIVPSGALGNINLPPGTLFPPVESTSLRFILNLNVDDPIPVSGPSFSSAIRIFDSLGSAHNLTIEFTKTGAGTYDYEVFLPAQDVGGLPTDPPVSVQTGSLTFDTVTGALTDADGGTTDVNIDLSGQTFTNGATGAVVSWDLFDDSGNGYITNYSSPSATSSSSQNGFSAGSLVSFNIGPDGTLSGTLSNGQTVQLARVALATFNNPGGLIKVGNNKFTASVSSGEPSLGVPSEGGRGSTTGGTLELSNVDISTEFIKMIVAQRGYQANSRMISATDQVLQESINLVR